MHHDDVLHCLLSRPTAPPPRPSGLYPTSRHTQPLGTPRTQSKLDVPKCKARSSIRRIRCYGVGMRASSLLPVLAGGVRVGGLANKAGNVAGQAVSRKKPTHHCDIHGSTFHDSGRWRSVAPARAGLNQQGRPQMKQSSRPASKPPIAQVHPREHRKKSRPDHRPPKSRTPA